MAGNQTRPPVVTGTADLDGRGSDNTTERGSSYCRTPGFTTEGGRPAPEPQGSPRGVRAVPTIFTEGRSRDSGLDRQKDIGSPVDLLVDTVARMQQDLTRLREENRLLRTPAIPQVVQAPRRAAFTSTKVPRFDGTTSWEQYRQVFDAIVRSNGLDNDKQHCNCSLIWRGTP